MDFTRQPITESIITPKSGSKLVVRSSKGAGQEEFFVDSVEVVCFGSTYFFRCLEKPKSFLVPVSDYEVLEVRETRIMLKNVGSDKAIKIAGGKETSKKKQSSEQPAEEKVEAKRKERKRNYRKRRTTEQSETEHVQEKEGNASKEQAPTSEKKEVESPLKAKKVLKAPRGELTPLLPPPSTLIRETIEQYKESDLYKDVFIDQEVQAESEEKVEKSEEPEVKEHDTIPKEITSVDQT